MPPRGLRKPRGPERRPDVRLPGARWRLIPELCVFLAPASLFSCPSGGFPQGRAGAVDAGTLYRRDCLSWDTASPAEGAQDPEVVSWGCQGPLRGSSHATRSSLAGAAVVPPRRSPPLPWCVSQSPPSLALPVVTGDSQPTC